ncbi:MAG: ATP-binding cassette domain-containing protein, partial [Planctomycetia bacterium]
MLVRTEHLTKRYGSFTALDGCSLSVPEGAIFGLLGPNGAGKTTLLRLLMGYITPTAGAATVAGFDCVRESLEVRARTAYLPGEARLFRRMNGHRVLDFFAGLRPGCSREVAAAEMVERLLVDDLAGPHDGDVVARLLDLREHVRGKDHRAARRAGLEH